MQSRHDGQPHAQLEEGEEAHALTRRRFLAGAGAAALGVGALRGGIGLGRGLSRPALSPRAAKPAHGGNFRLGVTGGGSKDLFDGQNIITKPDQARLVSAFETLLTFDENYRLTNGGLAEEVSHDNKLQYTIRIRKGVEFQNGKPFRAEDVLYSLQRILTKANGLTGYASFASVDAAGLKALDQYTVRMPLKTPDATIPQSLAAYTVGMVPVGYKPWPHPQYGTGAYTLQSFTPGQQSVSVKNKNYWRSGQPYFDQITIIDFADPTAQVNALLAGEIDAMTDLPASQVAVAKSHGLQALISRTGGWLPLCMAIDMAPFTDNNVREAMRWIVDRKSMIEQVASGYGFVANDLYSPFDAGYDSALPQREQDISRAKFLLKKAGVEGMTIDLHTTPGASGMVSTAEVFANQASAAGITINVHNDPNYYGNSYLKLGFSVDFWGTRSYLPQVQQGSLPTSPYNETHWPPKSGPGSNFLSLYNQALAATSTATQIALEHEMQTLEYNYGGYIIPFFGDLIDGYSSKVQGLQPSKGTLNLDSFGHGFRTIWFG